MIRTLIFGAALGAIGKKLFDEGKLDPYIDQARAKLNEHLPSSLRTAPTSAGSRFHDDGTGSDVPVAPAVGTPLG